VTFDLIVFSHLRWDFVYQRPQHLLSRAAKERRVYFVEEPIHAEEVRFETRREACGVTICVPHVKPDTSSLETERLVRAWVGQLVASEGLRDYAVWYYTPMALPLGRDLNPKAIIYDCMDELSAFKFAPPELTNLERELMEQADVMFTGGYSLYESKRKQHANVHPMPSSVDAAHFQQARQSQAEPPELANIPHPRVGFVGVIDERMDIELLGSVAERLPDVQFVMVGPVVKIDPASLPTAPNLHYLGGRSYAQLPQYLAHWDAAILPFALNDSTRFISPTKTPEYLAAGKPVVSTPIRDVVRPYGEQDLVQIALDADEFAAAVSRALEEDQSERRARADALISGMSWDRTWREMCDLIEAAIAERQTQSESALDLRVVTPKATTRGAQTTAWNTPKRGFTANDSGSGGGSD
jgi:glycosyltransferase involved in cell wall biosynthesis